MIATGASAATVTMGEEAAKQFWFSYLVAFAGLVLQAAIIGGVTNLFDNLDERANEKRRQLEELDRWMMYERVPVALQNRVRPPAAAAGSDIEIH